MSAAGASVAISGGGQYNRLASILGRPRRAVARSRRLPRKRLADGYSGRVSRLLGYYGFHAIHSGGTLSTSLGFHKWTSLKGAGKE